MKLKENKTETICFFSLTTDLDKTFVCIQYYLYLKKKYPEKRGIILYDSIQNSYYSKLFSNKGIPDIEADTLNMKKPANIENYLDYDFIIFDISKQNYNIYESFLYNSQIIIIVNNELEGIHDKELKLNRAIHKEAIHSDEGIKLFPVTHSIVVINKFKFGIGKSQKQLNLLLSEVANDFYTDVSNLVLNEVPEKDISELTNDRSYIILFDYLDRINNPIEEEDDDDDNFIYSSYHHQDFSE